MNSVSLYSCPLGDVVESQRHFVKQMHLVWDAFWKLCGSPGTELCIFGGKRHLVASRNGASEPEVGIRQFPETVLGVGWMGDNFNSFHRSKIALYLPVNKL